MIDDDDWPDQIMVGPYTVTRSGEGFWIEHDSGEGMQVSEGFMCRVIADIFNESF